MPRRGSRPPDADVFRARGWHPGHILRADDCWNNPQYYVVTAIGDQCVLLRELFIPMSASLGRSYGTRLRPGRESCHRGLAYRRAISKIGTFTETAQFDPETPELDEYRKAVRVHRKVLRWEQRTVKGGKHDGAAIVYAFLDCGCLKTIRLDYNLNLTSDLPSEMPCLKCGWHFNQQ